MKEDNLTVVETIQPVLANLWRQAGKHIEIGEFAVTAAKMFADHLPISQLLVRRFDVDRLSIDTVAVGFAAPDYLLPDVRTECTAVKMEEARQWAQLNQVARRGAPGWADTPVEVLVPTGLRGDVLLAPISDAQGPIGVLLVAATDHVAFDGDHAEVLERLLEPFSTALENDRRLREVATIKAAVEADKHSLLSRLGSKNDDEVVVGAEAGLSGVVERVGLVARSDAPVLILGETGTGKEVIARMIHSQSPRASGPFMRVNCGAIPSELIDSQLFGHERGAFTGAVDTREGWFERANGGTLLLDEVGELPLAAQVRLLRILQDGWLEKVGGQKPIHVDVRIIAATHRDLATMVSQGKFREDLWYRIAVFPIILPPLRERTGDIPELARHFAERAAARFALPKAYPSMEDIALLSTYSWPGNIRELAAVIDRAAILGEGKRLEIAKALGVTNDLPSTSSSDDSHRPIKKPATPRFQTLDEAMKQHIESALTIAHGRIEGRRGAAQLLQINPHTLRARMRKLSIDWTQFRREEEFYL
jgi:transcriptional regulator with GAF, ATPase, and Fis domain